MPELRNDPDTVIVSAGASFVAPASATPPVPIALGAGLAAEKIWRRGAVADGRTAERRTGRVPA